MAAKSSAETFFAWGSRHGNFILRAVIIGISTLAGAMYLTGYVYDLETERRLRDKDLAHQRELHDRDAAFERELRDRYPARQREVLERDLEHERELRMARQQNAELHLKAQLFDAIHREGYEAAARLLQSIQAASTRPPTD
ncbi:hypothetical protein MNEG_5772 [Monoraphidium neglectum]|jgi:hypothetical protein|uniref:Uncharacterized protein n=1 Tax=Monoraphidium neglectum TaxID=145388 RepID=A0A0D2MNW7_9CHLO|nr:hypothetical protein MNEG_5772 [Monoraphidium neglectum]KIZ02187.1 hypothetical protein MNEG_5772 [Monoraphidium neglectum]|eukprot:XP_013901206.1 hypothetical protein MNEG_5772 [Monoraphidium neglectum]